MGVLLVAAGPPTRNPGQQKSRPLYLPGGCSVAVRAGIPDTHACGPGQPPQRGLELREETHSAKAVPVHLPRLSGEPAGACVPWRQPARVCYCLQKGPLPIVLSVLDDLIPQVSGAPANTCNRCELRRSGSAGLAGGRPGQAWWNRAPLLPRGAPLRFEGSAHSLMILPSTCRT